MIAAVRIMCLVVGALCAMCGLASNCKTKDKVANYIFSIIFFLIAMFGDKIGGIL